MPGGTELIKQSIESENQIDANEVKKIKEGLSNEETKKDFSESVKENAENMSDAIVNYFKGDNSMNMLTADQETKDSYINIIDFLMDARVKNGNDLYNIKMGNIKMGLSGEGYKRLKDQSKDKPELMDKYFAYQNEHNDPNLERFFGNKFEDKRMGVLNERLDDENNAIYKGISDAIINKKYKNQLNDVGLMEHLHTYAPDNAGKKEIQEYIKKQTTGYKIKNIYDGEYNLVNRSTSETGDFKNIIEGAIKVETEYKKEQLQKSMKETVDDQLVKYTSLSEDVVKIKKNLYDQVDKIVSKYDYDETKSNYKKRDAEKSSFKKEINLALNEVVAEQNREYIAERFKTLKSVNYIDKSDEQEKTVEYSEKEQAHFESMLKETKDKDINTFAMAIDYPNMRDSKGNSMILKELWKKIKERGDDDKSIAFFGAKIHSATNIEEIQAIEQNTDTNSKYTAQLEATKKTNSIESSTETMFSVLDTYLKNADVKSLTVNVPKGNNVLLNQVKEVIQRAAEANPNGVAIDIAEVDNAKEVKIVSREKTETPGNIKLDMKKLNANVIGDATKINELLAGADPTMKAILEDPNYKITGGNVFGSASRNRTTREKKFADLGTNVNVKDGMPVNEPKNDALTNNPGLAYDRAASFIDYFMGLQDKVSASAKFDLTYGVNGPTRKELTAQLTEKNGGKTPTESQILEAFKEWQYATIDLDFLKTEEKTQETVVPVEELQAATGFQIYIKAESVKTASNTPPTRIRIGGGGGGGYTPPRRPRAIGCPTFGCYAYN